MDGVPLKMPEAAAVQQVKDDIKVTLPDYLTVLRETEYVFSLEHWVLTGLQSGFSNRPEPASSSSGLQPSCPPYWMMFRSPQQSRLASRHSSDFWEPNPRQRSHSLNPTVLRAKFTISDSEEEGERAAQKAKMCVSAKALSGEKRSDAPCKQKRVQRAFVPDLLNPPACLSSLPHQRRKNLRQCSLSVLDTPTQLNPNTNNKPQNPSSPRSLNTKASPTRANTVDRFLTISNHNTSPTMRLKPDVYRNPPATLPPRGLPFSGSDSSAELLSLLSPEERDLLRAITSQGYPLYTAITALQRTGHQRPDQIVSYLVACEHLCQLGYDMAQVEEALEMFQNCETKAEEFLQLLRQFNEMGFQQNAIKEVLLVHENHRERALEELMMRAA
ncbi:ubiquitin-associated protein 1-like [Mugil cephalus]|uniref:ubiquitin-associated protein 1-like n=1 Tax=Mugil cephalus TaxID=48193 RepID=UPI001FB783A9|nr:ubiquitin-associated protein 1-like [Mugil cephalus]XP_047437466.1 ubiquitin-associated protein 1-like [Mugil cephalus]